MEQEKYQEEDLLSMFRQLDERGKSYIEQIIKARKIIKSAAWGKLGKRRDSREKRRKTGRNEANPLGSG